MTELDGQHLRLLEALLFASAEPVSEKALTESLPDDADLPALLDELRQHYAKRGVHLVRTAKTWAFRTAPDLAPHLVHERKKVRKLGRAMLETLAVIAYHQPVTRAEVEEIRGVGFNRGALDVLLESGWIKPVGRRQTPGRPITWGTTDRFLDQFSLGSLDDLPGVEELKAAGLLDKRPAVEIYGTRGLPQRAEDLATSDGDDRQASLFEAEETPPDGLDFDDGGTDGAARAPERGGTE